MESSVSFFLFQISSKTALHCLFCRNEHSDLPLKKDDMLSLEFETGKGPPIRGECGLDYRPSENYAIESGLKPWVVEVKVSPSRSKQFAR